MFAAANSVICDMKKIIIPFFLFTILPFSTLSAQEAETGDTQGDDLEMAVEVGVEKKLSKKWSVGLDAEYRLRDSGSESDRVSFGPKVEYKIMKHLKASVGGVYMQVNNASKTRYRSDGSLKWIRASKWSARYRTFAAVTGDMDFGRFNVSLRERWQFTYRDKYTTTRDNYTKANEYNNTTDVERASKSYHVLRSRLAVSYDIAHCPLKPSVSAEFFNSLNDSWRMEKVRYACGVTWKVTKRHSLDLTYYYQTVNGEDDEDDINTHYLSVGYKFKF